ncbi:MAG: hypothetical protein ACLQRM_20070 [Acidimicrobiales bacterium]|jgi:hypothetical protein
MLAKLHRNLAGGFAVLAAGLAVALPSPARLGLPAARSSSVVAEAEAINLKVTDLSPSIHWVSASAGKTSKAAAALAVKTIACLEKVGPVSPDPFGTRSVVGGVVVADVSSPTYYDKAATLTQLPSASSEVVFLKTASESLTDLSTIARSGSLACLTAQLVGNSTLEGAGKVKGSASFMAAPHHGAGSGGVHIRFVESGGNFALLKSELYDDEYFYVQGPAEISMSFINLGSPFNPAWATAAISKVMARAQSTLGKA